MRSLPFLLSAALLLAGCATLNTHVEPKTDLTQLKHVFVQQNLNDNHSLDVMIVRELQAHGLQAESGPMTMMPLEAKAYLTYRDEWVWDFKDYLISLGITVRDARTDAIMATVNYSRPSAFLRSSFNMVRLTVDALFNAKPEPEAKPAGGDQPRK